MVSNAWNTHSIVMTLIRHAAGNALEPSLYKTASIFYSCSLAGFKASQDAAASRVEFKTVAGAPNVASLKKHPRAPSGVCDYGWRPYHGTASPSGYE
jgi:hypothetical protein